LQNVLIVMATELAIVESIMTAPVIATLAGQETTVTSAKRTTLATIVRNVLNVSPDKGSAMMVF